jgi:hypothetical protein
MLIFIFLLTHSLASTPIDLSFQWEYLNLFSPSVSRQMCSASSKDFSPISYASSTHQIKFHCSEASNLRALTRLSAVNYCLPAFGDSAWTCAESHIKKREERASNSQLINELKKFSLTRFDDYKKSLAALCCGDKKQCRERFLATSLRFDPSNRSLAHYHSDNDPQGTIDNYVNISYGKLAENYTLEGVERVLLHELGHSCQFAIISENAQDYALFVSESTACLASTGEKFLKLLSRSSQACLINKLKMQRDEISQPQNFCFGKWYREAFADMVFRSEMKTIYHWIYDLHRRTPTKTHPNVLDLLECEGENFPRRSTCFE